MPNIASGLGRILFTVSTYLIFIKKKTNYNNTRRCVKIKFPRFHLKCRPVDNPAKDVLSVEVWDFDPAETLKEKVTKVGEVKGFRGMKRFVKELAQTATAGQHDNEIIGSTQIPLKVQ